MTETADADATDISFVIMLARWDSAYTPTLVPGPTLCCLSGEYTVTPPHINLCQVSVWFVKY